MDPRQVSRRSPAEHLDRLARWARLLDGVFRVPLTSIRFGWDPILGILPVVGDLVSPLFGVLVLAHGIWLGLPKIVLARIVLNCAIDAGIGSLPIVGDVFDVFWPANQMNLRLLGQHARGDVRPSVWDYVFVFSAFAITLGLVLIPFIVIGWGIANVWGWL